MKPERFQHFAKAVDLPEVLELFARHAGSPLGRDRLRALAPSVDLGRVRRWHEEVEELLLFLDGERRVPTAGICDATALADHAREHGRPLEPAGLSQIADAIGAAESVRVAFRRAGPATFPALGRLADDLPDVRPLRDAIQIAIEGEHVRSTASPKLGEIRRQVERIRGELDRRAQAIAESPAVRPALQSPKPCYRGGRYVLAVRAGYRPRPRGILHDRSQTGGTLYLEPHELMGLGNELSDLLFRERDEETRVLWELSREVFATRDELAELTRGLAGVDALCAKAQAAKELGLRAVEVVEDGPLVLREARHPLLVRQQLDGSLPSGEVVPLSLRLGDAFDLLVITGPNTGGKTVTLKTAGLLAALALCGCPLPVAAGSQVPMFDGFFADVGDEQAIEQSLSTFSGHMAEIVRILAAAGPRSLVLIDELGAGTDPEEGSALGAAVLEALARSGARGVVTTHLGSLKAFAYSRPRVENAAVSFDLETLAPSYHLRLGVPGASHAIDIAARLGLPASIVERAEAIRGQKGVGETELLDTVQQLRREAELDREAARGALQDAVSSRAAAEDERAGAARERAALARESDAVLEALLQKLKAALARARMRAANMPRAHRQVVIDLEADLLQPLEHTPFAKRRRAFARTLKKGARVHVVSFEREGVVTRIHKGKERVTVRLGASQIETDFHDLSWVDAAGRAR